VVSGQWSVVGGQRSVVGCQLSVECDQFVTIVHMMLSMFPLASEMVATHP
jgi:hypothetical protein